MSMLDETRELLAKADLAVVSGDTGIPLRWLYKIRKQEIPNPGAPRLEKLWKHLKNHDSSSC